jgi:thiol peroxidase
MSERKNEVTFQGSPLTLIGNEVGPGDPAPDASLLTNDLNNVSLEEQRAGGILIVASVPSLDTSVCSDETKRFNQEAESLPGKVRMVVVSMDLPFAQKRWADEHGAAHVTLLSDHRHAAFGDAYGVLIQELRLLARAVFVIDKGGKIVYRQLVGEITEPPDYDAVLRAAREQA